MLFRAAPTDSIRSHTYTQMTHVKRCIMGFTELSAIRNADRILTQPIQREKSRGRGGGGWKTEGEGEGVEKVKRERER